MKYKVLISEHPIPSVTVADELRALGLFVSFVPSDPTFNIYVYQPLDSTVALHTINHIHYFEDHNLLISKAEFEKHFAKVDDYNHIELGDSVRIHGYKNLVTEVESILGDRATTKINLRGFVFRFEEDINLLSRSEVIFQNREEHFQYCHESKLFVDLFEFDQGQDSQTYISDIFNHLLRLKISSPKSSVILLNPKFDVDKLFGLDSVKALNVESIVSELTDKDSLYSRNYSLYSDSYKFLTKVNRRNLWVLSEMDYLTFKEETSLDTAAQFRYYTNLQSKAINQGRAFSPKSIMNRLKEDNIHLKAANKDCFVTPKLSTVQLVENDFCVEETLSSLLESGHVSIAENLDYYIGIIRG